MTQTTDAAPAPDDVRALRVQNGALRTLNRCLEQEIAQHRDRAQEYHAATTTLDSEREANRILTDTIEAQARRIEALEGAGAGAGEPIVPPVNGETDPQWAAIKRAIDQFAGRIPTISKHRAVTNVRLAAVVERLDAAGDKEAADTIVWQAWWRALDRERERFLLAELTPTVTP